MALGPLAMGACTPLGGWLYDDPSFAFSEITLRGQGTDTLEMVLTACNLNDFPVEARAMEVALDLEGARLGQAHFEQAFMLQTRNTTKITVALPLPPGTDFHRRRSFLMSGYTMVETPIGQRRINLSQEGSFQLGLRDEVATVDSDSRPCRPGLSTLPSYMPPVQLLPPPPEQPRPTPGQGP